MTPETPSTSLIRHGQAHQFRADHEEFPEPGSWWRVNAVEGEGDAAEISRKILEHQWDEGQEMPPHGIILLLTDTRYVDGELHSLVLAPHPGWDRQGQVKLTLEQFSLIMSAAPDGAELRELEKARAMGHAQGLHEKIAEPPREGEIVARVEEKKLDAEKKAEQDRIRKAHRQEPATTEGAETPAATGYADFSRLVPAALLPSQDIAAAEAAIQGQILRAEATRELIEARIQRASRGMAVISRYQQEVVATALAGISKQRQFADKMLSSVHTMKLWLGDGVEIFPVLDGAGAPEGEPVHFMQQLLYLDEEIHTAELVNEGFNSDNLRDLPRFLEENPDIVSTMLPHPRCVVLARIRRHPRELVMGSSISELFVMLDARKADETILIFARDGERLSIIRADDETSRAERLFPSRHEIDGIFVSRDWRDGDIGKVIDVSDVRYAEKRAAHDNVALFYKRFLLILWGAHERAEIFGSLPKGMNWLTGETHNRHFRFIHDEEHGLEDKARMPVMTWIRSKQADLRAGSRVVVCWKDMLTPEDAPAAWNRPEHHQQSQIREPIEPRSIVTVEEADGELFLPCSCSKMYESRETLRRFTVRVRIARDATAPKCDHDIFVLDHMSSAEIDGYLKSRKARQSYLRWMAELKLALPEIRRRERLEEALCNRILAARPDLDAAIREKLPACVHEAVLASDWELPAPSADAGIVAQARILSLDLPEDKAALSVAVRRNGTLIRNLPQEPLFDGLIDEPFVRQQICALKRGVGLVVKSERMVASHLAVAPGDVVLKRNAAERESLYNTNFKIPSIADRNWMQQVLSDSEPINDLLDRALNPSSSDAKEWVKDAIRLTNEKGRGKVLWKDVSRVVGFALVPPSEDRDRILGKRWSLRMIRLDFDPVRHAWLSGYRDEARIFAKIFANPSAFEKHVDRMEKTPTLRILLDGAADERSWRKAAEREADATSSFASFRDLVVTAYGWQKTCEAEFTFDRPELCQALLRPIINSRSHTVLALPEAERQGWLTRQADIRIFLPDGVEERLMRVISMFEPLPGTSHDINDPATTN